MHTRLYAASIVILVLGVASGLLIYLTAGEETTDLAIEQIITSKPYVRELQRFGGKASVVFDEFGRWFAGLWRGKSLGATIACLSALVSLGLFLLGRRLEAESDRGDDRD